MLKLKTLFLLLLLTASFASCSKKKSPGSVDSGGGVASALSLPSSVEIIKSSASNNSSRSIKSLKTSRSSNKFTKAFISKAFDDAGTDYSSSSGNFHIYHPALENMSMPDEILCFLGQLKYDTMMNKGAYFAMVDDSKCESAQSPSDSSSGNSSSSTAVNLIKATVISSRASGSVPHIVQIWFDERDGPGGSPMTIKVYVTISEGPSASKPFGNFDLIFGLYNDLGTRLGGGRLKTVSGTAERPVAFTFIENFSMPSFGYSSSKRSSIEMALDASGNATEGRAAIAMESTEDEENGAFLISYAGENVLVGKGASLDAVDVASPTCMGFGDDNLTEIIHGYNLFNSTSGALVKINSGFSFTYGSGSDLKRGHLGYHGLWIEGENGQSGTLDSGESITKIDWSDPSNNQDLTLFKAPGKLMKNTVKQLALADLGDIQFNFNDWQDPDAPVNGAFLVKYLPSGAGGAGFYKVGTLRWSSNGPPSKVNFASGDFVRIDTSHANYQWMNMYSEQLRGSVQFVHGKSYITYYVRDVVLPTDSAFSGGSLELKCLRDCLKSNISSSDMNSWNGVFLTAPTNKSEAISYTMSSSEMVLKRSGVAVGLAAGVNYSGQFQWGLRNGPMVSSATFASMTNLQDIYNTVGSVFYEWEQGENNWSQLFLAKDADNNFISFDAPLKINYTHLTAKDRNDLSSYNNQTFLLEYGGPGSLWGFPSEIEDTDGDGNPDRWMPLVGLKDGVLLGGSNEYVVKAMHGEKVMNAIDESNCLAISLSAPLTAIPSASEEVPAPSNHSLDRPTESETSGRICAPNPTSGDITCAGI